MVGLLRALAVLLLAVSCHYAVGSKDHYSILGVDRSADDATLKRAYRALARCAPLPFFASPLFSLSGESTCRTQISTIDHRERVMQDQQSSHESDVALLRAESGTRTRTPAKSPTPRRNSVKFALRQVYSALQPFEFYVSML